MDSRTQERVDEWDSRPFSGGFDGLSDLAAVDFSGAVSAAGTWLFMLNGRIVGVFDGDIDDFETAAGTQYEAPHPSLPLLCTMEERGGETRANYYTNETALREVDETLRSGSFTGYVELSENVLSGDYYAVYYGGRRMAAAYIGNAGRLITGEDAFDRAADEVGIYEVVDVDIDVTDVPGSPDDGIDSEEPTDVDSNRRSRPETDPEPDGSESGIDIGIPGGDGADSDSADDHASSVDPINLGSSDDVTSDPSEDVSVDDSPTRPSDVDLTEDPTGITSGESAAVDSEGPSAGITSGESAAVDSEGPSAGITEAEPTADRNSSPSTDVGESRGRTGTDGTDGIDGGVGDEPTEGAREDASIGDDAPADDETETDAGESGDAGTDGPTDPDLAEVEAAAEELDRNISWVDEEGTGEDDEDDGDRTATEGDGPETAAAVAGPDGSSASASDGIGSDGNDLEEQFEREERWRETRRIPSIDPDDSDTESGTTAASTASRNASAARQSTPSNARTSDSTTSDPQSDQTATSQAPDSTAGAPPSDGREDRSGAQSHDPASERQRSGDPSDERARNRIAALSEEVETLREQRDALETNAEELEAERNRLRSENDDLTATVEQLRSRIRDLEAKLKRAGDRDTDATKAETTVGTRLSPTEALSETNLFVRYASKSQPTLETAHDGAADRSEVTSNLRLEHHTQFDSVDAVVDGEPYEDFLASTMEFRFVNWLTGLLLYEIRDTGNANALADLYDVIPRIDRAELGATISLADDDTDDVPDRVSFDIVAFDKMGNPLVLASLNDSREPASKALLEQLEEASSAVKANYPSLAASMAVTSSYFEPGALEVAERATSGGFLSRGSKLSYVNLSRKEGYHLCLVESRSEGFHMTVPEL